MDKFYAVLVFFFIFQVFFSPTSVCADEGAHTLHKRNHSVVSFQDLEGVTLNETLDLYSYNVSWTRPEHQGGNMLQVLFMILAAASLIVMIVRLKLEQGRKWNLNILFLIVTPIFCIVRMVQIVLELQIEQVYNNMIISFVLQNVGRALLVGLFTVLGLVWCDVFRRARSFERTAKIVRRLLIIGLIVLVAFLVIMTIIFVTQLKYGFGINLETGPSMYTTGHNQQGLALEVNNHIHGSYTGSLAIITVYCLLLSVLFLVLAVVLMYRVTMSTRRVTASAKERKKLSNIARVQKRYSSHILFVTVPTSAAFLTKFIAGIYELASHDHENKFLFYMIQYISEVFIILIMLIHSIMTTKRIKHLKSLSKSSDQTANSMTTLDRGTATSGQAGTTDEEDDEEMAEVTHNKGPKRSLAMSSSFGDSDTASITTDINTTDTPPYIVDKRKEGEAPVVL